MGGLRHRALSVETEDRSGRSGPHLRQASPTGIAEAGRAVAHAAVAHEIDIRVVVVGRPMALKVVEKYWPIERQPMCLEVPHRERECMIDPDQCRLVFSKLRGQPLGNATPRPVFARAGW